MIDSNKQIKLGAFLSYFAIFFNIIAGLLYTPWMISKIGKADYGLYMLVTSFLTYFIVDFGLWQAISRYITKYRAEGKENEVQNIIGLSAKIYLVLDIIVCIILFILYFFLDRIFVKLTPEELVKFRHIYLIAACASVISLPFIFVKGIYMSYELFIQTKLFDVSVKFFSIVFTVVALSLGYKLYMLVLIYACVPCIINFIRVIYLIKRNVTGINWKYYDKKLLGGLFNVSFWLVLIVLGELFIKNIAPSILGIFSGTEEIAVFAIGSTIDGYIYVFSGALNGLFLPKVSQLIAQEKDTKALSSLMLRVGRIQAYIVGFLILGVFLIGSDFIQIWVGSSFSKSYYVACLLILPNFIFLSQQIGATILLAQNKLKYNAYMYLFAAIISSSLSVLLAPSMGAVGAALGICIGTFLFFDIGLTIIYQKSIHLDMRAFLKDGILSIILRFIPIIILFLVFSKIVQIDNLLISFIYKGILFFLLYIVVMYFFSFNKEEKHLFFSFFKKNKHIIK
ncbi:MAG: lipopolysaccharide biosynthesis protein [Barnesiella sp.]